MYAQLQLLFQKIAQKIDATAMYRTVTLMLVFLVICGLGFGVFGLIPYTPLEQLVSLVVVLVTALLVNNVLSNIWRVPINVESAIITALIIYFLVIPAQWSDLGDTWVIAVVATIAMLSKFLLVWRKQHLVNPAAFGVLALAIVYAVFPVSGYFESSWWTSRVEFLIPLLLAGAVVVSKVRKWVPVLAFLSVGLVVFLFEQWRFGLEVLPSIPLYFISRPSLFLAFFMLTEPFTMPPTKKLQATYGALVGFISQTTLFLPFIKMTPELALVLGNLFFYPSTLKQKLILPLIAGKEIAKNTFEFAFKKPSDLHFVAGQYLEWMLPHHGVDNRGIRRYFTIASAPSESELKIAVRFGERVSTYKEALRTLKAGEVMVASQLAGDFTLPVDESRKVAMVAGGIGITPFISQVGEMVAMNSERDCVLFSCNNTLAESAYVDFLDSATEKISLRVVQVLAKETLAPHEAGYLTAELIKKHTPDFLEREWYLSGPPGMVNAYAGLLRKMGVRRSQVKRDFFPGLA